MSSSETAPNPPSATPPPRRAARAARVMLQLWLAYHLFAICAAPFSVAPSSSSQRTAWLFAQPYLQVLYLNHGFHFFSPEPAGSTLLGYLLEFEDGRIETGRLPHRGISPRLLYHRHFMLTEFLSNVPPEQASVWHRAYARELCRSSGAKQVTISKILHGLPTREKILAGGTLDDPELFTEESLGTFTREELLPDEARR